MCQFLVATIAYAAPLGRRIRIIILVAYAGNAKDITMKYPQKPKMRSKYGVNIIILAIFSHSNHIAVYISLLYHI
jgi:hypothetical protein